MENRVLVVDDNEFMLTLISHILDNEGYQVETYNHAEGLMEQINAYQPNLIILDVQLPDGDGRDLCRQIKQSVQMQDISVVMCSALDDLKDCYNQQSPPDGILQKPFDMRQLINLMCEKLPLAA
ncbi:PleD family two-component system response regulator [Mucilaginibacter terrae]|uniref:response regulator n=1 Tax=Mucilaginibacter terrae TaxID=1955052 RepID=UPI003633FE14